MRYVLSPSPHWTEAFLVGRFPGMMRVGQHLARDEAAKVTERDTVYVIGGWETGLPRTEQVRIEKTLHDSGARLLNGAGREYDWGYPAPWEHDGAEPGSAPKLSVVD